ncbi:hypothetical protein WEI85_20255 [Actinomycetes bacterium KLBMP 9797]
MKIFIAGASGAVGTHLVTQLVARGHDPDALGDAVAKWSPMRAAGSSRIRRPTPRRRSPRFDMWNAPTKHRRGNPA